MSEHSKKANGSPAFKNGRKENPGNYWAGSLTFIPRKVKEWLILENTSEHEDKKVVRTSNGFIHA